MRRALEKGEWENAEGEYSNYRSIIMIIDNVKHIFIIIPFGRLILLDQLTVTPVL